MVTRRTVNQQLKGFTLIEVLVSLVLFSIMLTTAMYGYQLYNSLWQRQLSAIDTAQSEYKALELVQNSLLAAIPYQVQTAAKKPGFYFLGRAEGLTLVTANPVFQPQHPAVIRLFQEKSADGGFQLVYEEASLQGMRLTSEEQELPFAHRVIVLQGLKKLDFHYLGWQDIASRTASLSSENLLRQQLFSEYDGLVRGYQPTQIQIQIDNFLWVVPLVGRAEKMMEQQQGLSE